MTNVCNNNVLLMKILIMILILILMCNIININNDI